MTDRRFIEESFPVKEVSAISAKEKSVRQGHISTLHVWWARKPLAASRATAYAALVPAASGELAFCLADVLKAGVLLDYRISHRNTGEE